MTIQANALTAAQATNTATNKRVLIVEDEPLLAMAMADQLSDHAFEVQGTAPTVSRALAMIAQALPDAAILDCNLRGESIAPVAELLEAKGVPFLFHTGYGKNHLSPRFAAAPCLAKPVPGDLLIATVCKLLNVAPPAR